MCYPWLVTDGMSQNLIQLIVNLCPKLHLGAGLLTCFYSQRNKKLAENIEENIDRESWSNSSDLYWMPVIKILLTKTFFWFYHTLVYDWINFYSGNFDSYT